MIAADMLPTHYTPGLAVHQFAAACGSTEEHLFQTPTKTAPWYKCNREHWRRRRSPTQVAVDTGRVDPDEAETAMDGSGVPMLELFLRKEGSDGELQRKLVAVRASPVEDASSMGQQLAESLQGLEGLDSSNAVLKVSSLICVSVVHG